MFYYLNSILAGKVLFPHVSSRNVKIEMNFGKNKDGEAQEAAFELPAGFKFAADCVATSSRGSRRYVNMKLHFCQSKVWPKKKVSKL